MEVIGVGIVAIDVIHEVAEYPTEDTKTRSLASRKCRGGNVTNSLVVCAQLRSSCRWLGVSTDPAKDPDAAFTHADLAAFGVDCSLACIETVGSMPVSYILTSRATGSRTIVHSRNLAELSVEAFAKQFAHYFEDIRQDVTASAWFHFEGRNMESVREMLLHVRTYAPQAKVSVEIEGLRYDWSLAKTLASLADYVFMSKDYLREKIGVQNAEEFFDGVVARRWGETWDRYVKAFICPWGAEGVYYLDMTSGPAVHHIPAKSLDRVVETIGAGDSFIGASVAGLSRGIAPLDVVLKTACDVATFKCLQLGFALPEIEKVQWQQTLQLPGERKGEKSE